MIAIALENVTNFSAMDPEPESEAPKVENKNKSQKDYNSQFVMR